VAEGHLRTRGTVSRGGLFDVGIYCIDALRYLFHEPVEVYAAQQRNEPAPGNRSPQERIFTTTAHLPCDAGLRRFRLVAQSVAHGDQIFHERLVILVALISIA